ncbi:MAG: uroporphyrinogen-III synthase [Bacteroidaceae bacterium]|nr:uroporphyrinogen-III synthase [Bacteroidaceae bacterium]
MIKKILVSQPKPSSDKSPYYDIERQRGVEIVFRPFIKVVSVSAKEFRAQHINILDYTAIVFNSRHAIDHFFQLCKELRVVVPDDMKYFCITEQVSHYIQKYVQYRKRKVFFGETGKIDGLLPHMIRHKNEKYFVPLSDVHNDEIANMMDAENLVHKEGVMYHTVSNDFAADEPFDYDMLVFFSPSGINSLKKNFPDFDQKDVAIVTFGPTTTKAAKDAGLRVDVEAPTPECPSITMALENYLKHLNEQA